MELEGNGILKLRIKNSELRIGKFSIFDFRFPICGTCGSLRFNLSIFLRRFFCSCSFSQKRFSILDLKSSFLNYFEREIGNNQSTVSPRFAEDRSTSKSGSALIAVLVLGVVMSLLVAEFGQLLRGDLQAAGAYSDHAKSYQLARSGIAFAQMELKRKTAYSDDYGRVFFLRNSVDYEGVIDELLLYRNGVSLGKGTVSYAFIRKPNALKLESLTSEQWHRLFEVACDFDEGDERSELVDCAMDWLDADNMERASGAEAETYESLDVPRYIRNGALKSTEELLQIYGFSREILYGDGFPVREEDGMLFGGGLYRYIVGDVSPEARASYKYILQGILAEESLDDELDEDEITYTKLQALPQQIYLLARGQSGDSEHVILTKLNFVKDEYRVAEWYDFAENDRVARLANYGTTTISLWSEMENEEFIMQN